MSCLVPTWHVLFLGEKLNLKPKHRRRRRRRRRLFVQTDPKILRLEDPLPRFGKEKKGNNSFSGSNQCWRCFANTSGRKHCVLPSGGKNTKKERNCVPTHKGFLSDACKILTGLPFFFPGIGSNSLVGGDCIPPGLLIDYGLSLSIHCS